MVFLCSHVEWSETLLSQKDTTGTHTPTTAAEQTHKHSNRETVTDAHTEM